MIVREGDAVVDGTRRERHNRSVAIEQSEPASAVAALLAALGEPVEDDASPPTGPRMPMFAAWLDRDEADGA